ncbi:3-keto-disaccharide hydrolase [Sphingobacterium psychroaquaticum]|uniref:3-keto-alpha-glucoside-1,2-lyase/3-keto-2-hydroxy-glucal hydratase domain-containing protein n=1 Tax=Sphingobacterium psychroaquaticum TaxID=561061 RepID=A0A1X7JLI4_9SPHI|nr:DUF1080 domain-containing protein [Sphingobacterium psychroaquaticum]QBQ40779.1 DUF1080 domain-containing protein [Sphingobacterium psychroaquaticum]SMG28679.1 protein of unknown function [Sphingobacterium psychroaquaticum]
MKVRFLAPVAIFAAACLTVSCKNTSTVPNTLSEKESAEGWKLLFDGQSMDQWHVYNKGTIPSTWQVKNGELHCDPESTNLRADLVTNEEFENYDLKFEWKLAEGGNSGVFINVDEQDSIPTTWYSGPEYQLLQDAHPDFDVPLKRPGCLYNFTPQKNFVKTKPKGEWNESRIVQKDGNITFYLNGTVTAEMDLKSKQWQRLVKTSSFKDAPAFGKKTKGKIALQDWAHGASFRNLKIKTL